MMNDASRAGVVDAVWMAGRDGQWWTAASIAEEVPFRSDEIQAALDFLVRYGFAESCVVGDKWFRMIPDTPSPIEAVCALLSVLVRSRTGLRSIHGKRFHNRRLRAAARLQGDLSPIWGRS